MNVIQHLGQFKIHKNEFLGKGQFGIVYRCFTDDQTIQKKICAKLISKRGKLDEKERKMLMNEQEISKTIRNTQNQNIVQIYEVQETDDAIVIVMEFCESGDLKNEIEERLINNNWYSETEAIEIMRQIINGYSALAVNKIIHRDLKPANIMISGSTYKISDFGMGSIIEGAAKTFSFSKVGTPLYAAPQIFFSDQYDASVDVYSLGVVFYQLIFYGRTPIQARNISDLKKYIKLFEHTPFKCPVDQLQNKQINRDLIDLIEKMLIFQENQRIKFIDLQSHPLFQKTNKKIVLIQGDQPKSNPPMKKNFNYLSNEMQDSVLQLLGQDNILSIKILNINQLTKQQRIFKFIQLLIAYGNLSVEAQVLFQKLNLREIDQMEYLQLNIALLGFKFSTFVNAAALAFNNLNLLSKNIKEKYDMIKLQESVKLFEQDKSSEMLQTKEFIQKEYYSINQTFLTWQNFFISKAKNISHQAFLDLLKLQDDFRFEEYRKWVIYFYSMLYSKYFSKGLEQTYLSKMNKDYIMFIYLCEKMINLDDEYPIQNYLNINIDDFSYQNRQNLQELWSYVEQSRKRWKKN